MTPFVFLCKRFVFYPWHKAERDTADKIPIAV